MITWNGLKRLSLSKTHTPSQRLRNCCLFSSALGDSSLISFLILLDLLRCAFVHQRLIVELFELREKDRETPTRTSRRTRSAQSHFWAWYYDYAGQLNTKVIA